MQRVLICHAKSSPAAELTVCRGSTPSQICSAAPQDTAGYSLLLLFPLPYLGTKRKEKRTPHFNNES